MFTGIIEEKGIIKNTINGPNNHTMTILSKKVLNETKLGDSIAVNGVCLTVCDLQSDSFSVDIMPETFRKSNLSNLKINQEVNLERAMKMDSRFGGHIVSGHIDGTGTLTSIKKESNAVWLKISTTPQIIELIINKGSITIDGVSLTVAKLEKDSFSVSIIPHTAKETILLNKKIKDSVNLENDIIGKYIKNFFDKEKEDKSKEETQINVAFLNKCGF